MRSSGIKPLVISRAVAALAVCAAALIPLRANAQSFNLSPVADAFVSSAAPDRNFGGGGSFAIAAPGLERGEAQSLMRFSTAAAKSSFDLFFGVGNWTVSGIALRLTAAMPNNDVFNSTAAGQLAASWMQNDSWVEGTGTPANPTLTGLTFNSLPGFLSANDQPAGSISFNGDTMGTTDYAINLTSGMSADILAGGLLSVRLLAADAEVAALFNSRSNNMPANRPLLVVTAVPEPASIALLSVAAALATRRGRQKA